MRTLAVLLTMLISTTAHAQTAEETLRYLLTGVRGVESVSIPFKGKSLLITPEQDPFGTSVKFGDLLVTQYEISRVNDCRYKVVISGSDGVNRPVEVQYRLTLDFTKFTGATVVRDGKIGFTKVYNLETECVQGAASKCSAVVSQQQVWLTVADDAGLQAAVEQFRTIFCKGGF